MGISRDMEPTRCVVVFGNGVYPKIATFMVKIMTKLWVLGAIVFRQTHEI